MISSSTSNRSRGGGSTIPICSNSRASQPPPSPSTETTVAQTVDVGGHTGQQQWVPVLSGSHERPQADAVRDAGDGSQEGDGILGRSGRMVALPERVEPKLLDHPCPLQAACERRRGPRSTPNRTRCSASATQGCVVQSDNPLRVIVLAILPGSGHHFGNSVRYRGAEDLAQGCTALP